MSKDKDERVLPNYSECNCPCHKAFGMIHVAPCCVPDRIAKTEPPAAEGEVTQADREAAAELYLEMLPFATNAGASFIREGRSDELSLVQAFKNHRLASRTTGTHGDQS